jgi:hypothetical protein
MPKMHDTVVKYFALLIGSDCYLPNRLPDGSYYPSLGGCVRDIAHVEAFLRARLWLPDEQLRKLYASRQGTEVPIEPKELWPTYENIVKAFGRVTEEAAEGDQVYVHYSGHGGRALTAFPEVKGDSGLDEALGSPST